jgi:hypothetical protein
VVTDKPSSTSSGTVFGGPPTKETTHFFVQPASKADKATFPVYAQQGYGNTHIVVGAKSKQVEVYNGATLRATVKLDVFMRIGRR